MGPGNPPRSARGRVRRGGGAARRRARGGHRWMKRLRWITPIPPCLDAGGGGEIRQAHLLAALADRFEVHLVSAGPLTDDRLRSRLTSVTEVDVPSYEDPRGSTRRRLRDIRWQLLERTPDEVARHGATRRALTTVLG